MLTIKLIGLHPNDSKLVARKISQFLDPNEMRDKYIISRFDQPMATSLMNESVYEHIKRVVLIECSSENAGETALLVELLEANKKEFKEMVNERAQMYVCVFSCSVQTIEL